MAQPSTPALTPTPITWCRRPTPPWSAQRHAPRSVSKPRAVTIPIRLRPSSIPFDFQKTPNGTDPSTSVVPGGDPCSDIWVLDGTVNRTAVIDGNEFTFSFFPEPAAGPLRPEICEAAGAAIGCIGFTTQERQANAIPFMMNVTPIANVLGRAMQKPVALPIHKTWQRG